MTEEKEKFNKFILDFRTSVNNLKYNSDGEFKKR